VGISRDVVAMETTNVDERKDRKPQTGFPRQFGIGTLFVITTLFAVLFAFLRTLNAHPAVYVVVGGFVVVIGLGQVFLFGGKQPREASLLVGGAIFFLGTVALAVNILVMGENYEPFLVLLVAILYPALGAMFGYFVGCVIGGVFLVGNWLNRRMEKRQEE